MRSAHLFDRMPRYAVGGVICALLHNIIMITLDHQGFDYRVSLIMSFMVVTPLGYVFHSTVTFKKARNWPRLRRYMAGVTSGFLVSAILMYIFCTRWGLRVPIATPIATLLLFFYNYVLARWSILLWPVDGDESSAHLLGAADGEQK